MANIAISFSICSPKYLNKAFLVLNVKFFAQHETFTFKQVEGTDFKFDPIHIQAATFKLGVLVPVTK